ncbi:hypothetical protein V5O48_017078 [Marasmius crinis-equi]|uniref:Aromatic compound dioxygenase n=1 Tax=Marasmius crinis-equi TaxID=585013 RepID=A0ABR3EPY6_9AGAR
MVNALPYLLAAATALTSVSAHAGPAPANWKRDNLNARSDLERKCGAELEARRVKRALEANNRAMVKRQSMPGKRSAILPRTTGSNDSTCLLTPEVTQGPYHILGEIVRQNMTQGQLGIPLEVSVDFFDIDTCEPVQVWIDAWHANATGFYSGYVAETGSALSGGFGGGGGDGGEMSMPGGMSMSGAPSGAAGPQATGDSTTTASYGAYDGADSADAASMLNTDKDDEETFLRGVWRTDEDGHLTMYSIVPGWYSGRAQHFHIKAYPEGYIADNGTFVASSSAVHTGQFFFDNATLEAVAVTEYYASNAIAWSDRVDNENDQWYPYQAAAGYNALMNTVWVGDGIEEGIIGSINVGLNMSYASPEVSTQYADFDLEGYEASSMIPWASATPSAW